MKILINLFSFLVLSLSAIHLNAQTIKCGTDQSDEFMKDLLRNKKDFLATAQKNAVDRFVPVQFHLVADNDGSGRVDYKTVLRALCVLNERYDSLGMYFYLADEMIEMNNTQVNNNPGSTASSNTMRARKNTSAMNVFVLQAPGTGIAGYYSREPNDYIVMGKQYLADDAFTIEHEIGHFFTLAHTHRGWEDNPYDPDIHGDTVLITTISSSQSSPIGVELVNGSNCGNLGWMDPIAGDGLCDTPPDYGFGQSCNCCFMQFEVWDKNGEKIEPMLDNVMSYSQNCSTFNFTSEQVLAIKTSYDSQRRNYVRNANTETEHTPLLETSVLVNPGNAEKIDSYDGVLLDWEPVEFAEEYIVTLDGTVTKEYITSATQIYLTDLKPNGNYLWSVIPKNKFGAGCILSEAKVFFTGNSTTSIKELSSISNFNIFPNPAVSNEEINLVFSSDASFEAGIKIYSLNGQLIESRSGVNISQGQNKIIYKLNNISKGLHFIEISSAQGIKIEKIIVE